MHMKREQEKEQVDIAIADAEMTLQATTNDLMMKSLQVAKVAAAAKRLEARLAPGRLEVLTYQGDGELQGEGYDPTVHIKKMNTLQKKLICLQTLAKAMTANARTPVSSAVVLRNAVQAAAGAEIEIQLCARVELLVRETSQALQDGEFKHFVDLLQNGAVGCPSDIEGFPQVQRAAVEAALRSHLPASSDAKDEESRSQLARVTKALLEVEYIKKNSMVAEDLQSFLRVLCPDSLAPEPVAELSSDLALMRSDERRPLHLLFLTCGGHIADQCDAWQLAHAKDVAFHKELKALLSEVQALGELRLPNPRDAQPTELNAIKKVIEGFMKSGSNLSNITANASDKFEAKVGADLSLARDACNGAVHKLEEFFARRYAFFMHVVIHDMIQSLKASGGAGVPEETCVAMKNKIDSTAISHSFMYYEKLGMASLCFDNAIAQQIGPGWNHCGSMVASLGRLAGAKFR